MAHLVKNPSAMRETWVGKIPWRKERLPTPVFWPREFHGPYSPWSCKESDTTATPVFWPREFHGLLVHGVTKSRTRLDDFDSLTHSVTCQGLVGASSGRRMLLPSCG